ncbi:YebC/PmpR family DNA-binding transcriptional regulator [Roseofilum reptotaenium CS-1145]|uniref:Probable transcriptional regulatory protein BI308_07080 n=1 Tax=Roseofilum reptotaenium AO1-A TaxID=1925591 RepID=A0A1L9QUU3_9CYAN|nr:YebC/PmpR family DNA-binding transcriptional regulator [Roseofilum reptotaenium]MDB9517678.1 YebC/PmpR family DNA-binding transcriptional regulator [Roseofilum reptotaenium CS-1145]OJJ26367.1 transcriptional regulator [Roseofilum reptotaenium AO1-A]
MAGHSKWANIKRQKARVDAKRGQVFTKVSREIIVAARSGADPAGNFQLRTAIEKAKAAGIPNDNIERAIAKGAGTWEADNNQYEFIRYEGYGPGGVAILIEAFTDKRNRTAADVREAFNKNGGNLGETGCVSWMFTQNGVVRLTGKVDEDQLLEISIEAGAQTYEWVDDPDDEATVEVFTEAGNLQNLTQTLQEAKLEIITSELRWIPNMTVDVKEEDLARSLLKLLDALEDLDDIQTVTPNFEMSDQLMSLSVV